MRSVSLGQLILAILTAAVMGGSYVLGVVRGYDKAIADLQQKDALHEQKSLEQDARIALTNATVESQRAQLATMTVEMALVRAGVPSVTGQGVPNAKR